MALAPTSRAREDVETNDANRLEGLRRLERSLAVVRPRGGAVRREQVLISWIANSFSIWPWVITAAMAAGAAALYVVSRQSSRRPGSHRLAVSALTFGHGDLQRLRARLQLRGVGPDAAGALPRSRRRGAALRGRRGRRGHPGDDPGAGRLRVHPGALQRLRHLPLGRRSSSRSRSRSRWAGSSAGSSDSSTASAWAVELRALEAERLRDELGRRADLLDAANRCVRALSSSLELDEAFAAFIRELNALLDFERVAIVTADGGDAHTLATAGAGGGRGLSRGDARPARADAAGRADQLRSDDRAAGDGSARVPRGGGVSCASASAPASPRPSTPDPRAVGMLSVSRAEPNSFSRVDGRAADAARAARRQRRPEHPRLRVGNGRPSRSCGGSRRCARISSRSSRTSCAARWRR